MFSRKVEAMHKDTKIGKKSSTGRDPVIGAEMMGVPEEQDISLFLSLDTGACKRWRPTGYRLWRCTLRRCTEVEFKDR